MIQSSSRILVCISIVQVTPDLPQLQALAAVVDAGSFEAAAQRLHLTPSAVSQRIKALEQAAGQVVVLRGRPAGVTPAGRAYLRLAREVDALVAQAEAAAGGDATTTVPIAVNADSLDTWVLPALTTLPDTIAFDLRREDQADTATLLRDGTVMAAITSEAMPVQGCRVTALGTMRYRPAATADFVDRWFEIGVDERALEQAPVVVFDRRDRLQDDYLARKGARPMAPRHHVPASRSFLDAVLLGLGWGMLPDLQLIDPLAEGRLVLLDEPHHVDVELYWQQWTLRTDVLDAVAAAVAAGAAALRVPGAPPAGFEPAT